VPPQARPSRRQLDAWQLVRSDQLAIVGAEHSFASGKVELFDSPSSLAPDVGAWMNAPMSARATAGE
jgi:hypothetical protein